MISLVSDDCAQTQIEHQGVCNMTMAGLARYLAFIGKFASSGLFTTDLKLIKKPVGFRQSHMRLHDTERS